MSKTKDPIKQKSSLPRAKTCINPYPSTFSPPPQQELADEPIAVGVGRPQASYEPLEGWGSSQHQLTLQEWSD